MWEREEYSTMFLPTAPFFHSRVTVVAIGMLGAAGQLEQELLGVSSGSNMAAISSEVDEGCRTHLLVAGMTRPERSSVWVSNSGGVSFKTRLFNEAAREHVC